MDKRTAVAVAVTIVFFIVWFQFVVPRSVPPQAPSEGEAAAPAAERAGETAQAPSVDQLEKPPVTAPQVPTGVSEAAEPSEGPEAQVAVSAGEPAAQLPGFEVPEEYRQENLEARELVLETDVLQVAFTTRTGSVKSVTLKNFQDFEREDRLVLLRDFTEGRFPTEIHRCTGEDISGRLWKLASEPATGEDGLIRVSFSTVLESGFALTKTYVLYPGKYGFALQVELSNLAGSPRDASYSLLGVAGIPSEDLRRNDVQGFLATVPAAVGLEGKMEIVERAAGRMIETGKNYELSGY